MPKHTLLLVSVTATLVMALSGWTPAPATIAAEQSPSRPGQGLATPTLPGPFGVTVRSELYNTDARRLAVDAGIAWVRASVDWAALEPQQGMINLSSLDAYFSTFQQLGLIPIVYIADNPSWAASTTCGPIDRVSLDEFGAFMSALALRYNGATVVDGVTLPRVDYWQLYNEPDIQWTFVNGYDGCWGANGDQYAQLLAVAWDVVHLANPNGQLGIGGVAAEPNISCDPAVWPSCPPGNTEQLFSTNVRVGCPQPELGCPNTDPAEPDFIDDVLDYIVAHPLPPDKRYFDFLDFHAYPAFANNWDSVPPYNSAFSGKAQHYRLRLESRGIDGYVISTEAGRPSAAFKTYFGVPGSDEEQSRYVARLYAQAMQSGLRAVTWFSYADYDSTLTGLLDITNQPKPSYTAYKTLTQQLGTASFVTRLPVPDADVYVFDVPGAGSRSLIWSSNTASSVNVTFPGSVVHIVDKWGTAAVYRDGQAGDQDHAVNGRVVLAITGSPIYVHGRPDVAPAPGSWQIYFPVVIQQAPK